MLKRTVSKLLAIFIIALAASQSLIFVNAQETAKGTMVAHYTFDGNLLDSSGNGLDGTAIGDISFTDGVSGKGASFDGGYVEVPHNDLLNLTNGYTISTWVYREDIRPNRVVPIVSKLGSSVWDVQPGYNFSMYDGYLQSGGWLPETADISWSEGKRYVDIKRWTMVTVTSDGEFLRFYVDGVLVDNLSFKAVFPASSGSLNIGFGNLFGESAFFKGIMDDVRIYNYAQSTQNIKDNYESISRDNGVVKIPNRLVAYYRFDTDLKDYSGFKNDASPISTGEGMAYATGVVGKGVKFKSNSYLEVNDNDCFNFEKGFSFSGWIYNSATTDKFNQPILQKLGASTVSVEEYPDFLLSEFRHSPVLTAFESYSSYTRDFNSDVECPQGSWHMLTVTSNGKMVKFYVDNALKAVKNEKAVIPNSSGKLLIGYDCFASDETSKYFEGMMDELKIYNYELQQNDVKALYDYRDGLIINPADVKFNLQNLKLGQTVKKNQVVKLAVSLRNIQYKPDMITSKAANVLVPSSKLVQNVTPKVVYKSSNVKVAKVSAGGAVTVIGKGQTVITVTYGSYKATQKVVVN